MVLSFTFFSCQQEETTIDQNEDFKANEATIEALNNWLNSNKSGRSLAEFTPVDIRTIESDGVISNGATNQNDPSQGIIFNVVNGEVENPIITQTVIENQSVITKLFSIDGELMTTIIDTSVNGNPVRTVVRNNSNGRVEGWWGEFDDCIGSFHNPTGCNVCDIAFVIVADAATATLYSWFSLAVCAGVTTGR